MRDIELEEGEAYFLQEDDDENIDPDRDFSYIDKKIENVLGHYQKDFMGGLSAESLGARFGGYGSFLPMQQRCPPILSNPTTQSHISSKSPQNQSSERLNQNSIATANHSLPVMPGLSSNEHNVQPSAEAGVSLTNKQFKLQSSGEGSFNDQQKKPLIHRADQSLLKFRVKMTSENVSSLDNSAIYSGLGLDMSPCSSQDDSPADYDRTSPGMQEKKEESPSCIVKIMTSAPLLNDALLSPLDDSLMCSMGMENNLEPGIPGSTQELPIKSIHGSTYSEAKTETSKERKSKLDKTNKDKKSKQKESSKNGKSKQKVQSMTAGELVKENQGHPLNVIALPANKRKVSEVSVAKAVVSKTSFNAADKHSEVMELAALAGNSNGSKPSVVLDKKNEFGHLEEVSNKALKQEWGAKAKDKSKGEFVAVPSPDVGMGGEGNVNISRGKIEKDKNVISNPSKDSGDRKNEVGHKEGEVKKFLKQQSVAKEKAKEEVLNSLFPKEDDMHRKETMTGEKISKHTEAGFISMKDVELNDRHFNLSQEKKDRNVETIEPSKKKSHLKAMSTSQAGAGVLSGKDYSSAVVKKKSKEIHADGRSTADLPRESLMSGYSAAYNEVMSRSNAPSKSKKGDVVLNKEMRKDIDSASTAYPVAKGKEVNPKDSVMGVSEREMHAFNNRKMKEKSSGKKIGFPANIGSSMEGDLAGGTTAMEKAPAAGVLPAENALSIVMDDWVECEKCKKWRLLPFGRNPDLLPKKWLCKMLDWLPGMNKCSVSEEETTNALYAMYQLQVPASLLQNNQQAYPDGSAPGAASGSGQPISLHPRAFNIDAVPGGGNKRNLVKTETKATRQSSFQELDIPVKKDQHFDENRNAKNLKKHPQDLDAVPKNGDGKSSKSAKKRVADFETSGVSKKLKRKSMDDRNLVGMLTVEAQSEGQNYYPGALQISEDFAKGIPGPPLMKAKDRTQSAVVSRVNERKDVSGKKRKLKDQFKSIIPKEELSAKEAAGKNGDTEHRKHKKEKKSKWLEFQAREGTGDKGNGRTHSDVGKHNFGSGSDSTLPRGSRMNVIPLEKHHADKAFQRTVDDRKASDKAHDLGLDDATTSSSSKISSKVKAKAREVKCSPVGSISSSPMKVSKSDPDKIVNKTSVSYDEPEELFSAKQLKSWAYGASNETASHNEEMRVRKSNLSKTSGIMFDASDDDLSAKKITSGRRRSTHGLDTHPKFENHAGVKPDISHEEGTSTSLQNFVSENQGAASSNRLHFDETNSQRLKSHVSNTNIKNEPSCHSHRLPKFEEGRGPNAIRVDKVSLRHPQPPRHATGDIGTSNSIADSFYKAAKTALKEATDLKHSANCLKKSGSGLESTEVFFQAALKFLHGASLLEPDCSESGRCGEMSPSDVYSTTAKLCEYCAREYERFNDMASAALAYKCMEVAYMRVVYYNDLVASQDRVELQVAVRAAPQAESPSSSASDIDNLNNQAAMDTARDVDSAMELRNHVISAGNRPNFMRLLDFTKDINLAMEASRRSQSAFAAANPVLRLAGNEEGISCIKRVLDFSFHDVDGLLNLVCLAMETLNN